MRQKYYDEVGSYYDNDAHDFEARYWGNPVLQRIRQSFREEVKRHRSASILEIGFGPGFDLVHFAGIYPQSTVFGVDISEAMVQLAREKITAEKCTNAHVAQGSVEDVARRFPGQSFDLIYVFFGALNTVENIDTAAKELQKLLNPKGVMILTFVNKYYIAGMALELLKGKWRSAFSRLRPVWGGYSPTKFLASKCYTPSEVRRAFKPLNCIKAIGYSIVYPAWYYRRIQQKIPQKGMEMLWNIDRAIAHTRIGRCGEYMLYVFKDSSENPSTHA